MHPPLIPEKHPICGEVRTQGSYTGYHVGAASTGVAPAVVQGHVASHAHAHARTARGPAAPARLAGLPATAAPPAATQFIEALTRCHKEHSVAKWWGKCNDEKFDLTKCLAAEKKVLR